MIFAVKCRRVTVYNIFAQNTQKHIRNAHTISCGLEYRVGVYGFTNWNTAPPPPSGPNGSSKRHDDDEMTIYYLRPSAAALRCAPSSQFVKYVREKLSGVTPCALARACPHLSWRPPCCYAAGVLSSSPSSSLGRKHNTNSQTHKVLICAYGDSQICTQVCTQ